MLEKQIEDKVCKFGRSIGFECYKFNSMARAAVPDRMIISPEGIIIFIEFKREGCKPTPSQIRELTRLRNMKVPAFVIDNVPAGISLLNAMLVGFPMMVLSDQLWCY